MTPAQMLDWLIQYHADIHFSMLGTVILYMPRIHWIERKTLEEAIREAQRQMAIETTLSEVKQVVLLEERKV